MIMKPFKLIGKAIIFIGLLILGIFVIISFNIGRKLNGKAYKRGAYHLLSSAPSI